MKSTFNVNTVKVEKLLIKTDLYSAYKITVFLSDRDKLLTPDLWPEDVVVDKFYNRSKKVVQTK